MIHTEEIIKAWGDRYEVYKDYINSEGWVLNKHLGFSTFVLSEPFEKKYIGDSNKEFDANYIGFRPFILKFNKLAEENKKAEL